MLFLCDRIVIVLCRSDFIYDLFEHMSLSTDQAQSTGFSRAQKKGAKKKATVSSQFKVQYVICSLLHTVCAYVGFSIKCSLLLYIIFVCIYVGLTALTDDYAWPV